MKILFINNYDSFVYNLVNYFCQLEPNSEILIEDNNISVDKVNSLNCDRIIISPGPGHPKYDTGMVIPIIKKLCSKGPIIQELETESRGPYGDGISSDGRT